jgi:hypothetical protein
MIVPQNSRSARRLHSADADVVFDGNRNTCKRTVVAALLDLCGTLQRAIMVYLEKRIKRLIEPLGGSY